MVLHSKNPLSGDDAKEPYGPVGYTKEPSLMQKNPMPSKEPPVSQKNPKGSLSAAKEPSFLRVYDRPRGQGRPGLGETVGWVLERPDLF